MSVIKRVLSDLKRQHSVKKTGSVCKDVSYKGDYSPIACDFLSERDKQKIIDDSNRLIQGFYQVFNYPVYTFKSWNRDPVTNIKVSSALCQSLVKVSGLKNRADVKNYWEQSHLYGAVTLAEAYSITQNEQYAEKCVSFMCDWIKKNPIGKTVSWKCPMDIAIRVANMVAASGMLLGFKAYTERSYLIIRSIAEQVDYITKYYENTGKYPNNHYLSDLVGVIWGSAFLDKAYAKAEMKQVLDDALDRLEKELSRQIYPCGFDYENSVYYHCFVTELVAETVEMLRVNGYTVPDGITETLERMLGACEYLDALCGKPLVLFGDQDSSRLFLLKGFFDADRCNFTTLCRFSRGVGDTSDGGIYRVMSNGYSLYFKCGNIGTSGKGTHDHNDQLSVCIYYKDMPIVIDGGTYCYTLDTKKRNLYRSEQKHSTVFIEGRLQNINDSLFSLKANGKANLTSKTSFSGDFTYASGETVSRKVVMTEQGITLSDSSDTNCSLIAQLLLPYPVDHFEKLDDNHYALRLENGSLLFSADNPISLTQEKYSYNYGSEKEGSLLSVKSCGKSKIMIGDALT